MKGTKKQQALMDKWLEGRPKIIVELARRYPPWQRYVLKGQEDLGVYTPIAYSEDGTIRCLKTDWLGMQVQVFGMKPRTLIPKESK